MKNRIIALLSCVALLLATATVFADTFKPKIYQVFVDDNGLMTILGTGFPEGGYVQTLKVGGIPAEVLSYDGVADMVQAQVPAQLGPGDYRLLVNFKLNNNAKNVIWDLSIGPQGPQGEQGEQGKLGEVGAQGEQGKLGPPGNDGDQGPQGKYGPQGVQGKMGPPGMGVQGDQGKLGPQGAQGKVGPQGEDGTSCSLGECSEASEATLSCGNTAVQVPCVPPPLSCPNTLAFLQGFLDGTIPQQTPNYLDFQTANGEVGACSVTANGFGAFAVFTGPGPAGPRPPPIRCIVEVFINGADNTALDVECALTDFSEVAEYQQPNPDQSITPAATFQCLSDIAALLPQRPPNSYNWSECGL